MEAENLRLRRYNARRERLSASEGWQRRETGGKL